MKKALSFLIIVLVLALSISLVSCNNQNDPNAQKPNSDYEAQIEELQKIIEQLNQGLISAEEAIKQLEDASANIKDWNDASAVLPEKLVELEEAYIEFVESVNIYDEKDENKEYPLVTFNDLYNFSYTVGEETVRHYEQFAELQYTAMLDLYRATSVAEMNTIIANFKVALTNVPTILDMYIASLEAVEKDGKVTYDEYSTILLAYQLAYQISNDNIYTPAEGETKGQKEILAERLDTLVTEFKPLVVEKFVELVNALPTVEQLAPSHYEAVEAAAEEAAFVIELYGTTEAAKLETDKKGKLTAYGTALETLAEVEARIAVVETIEAHAKALNEVLAKAFDKDNAFGFDTKKYGANIYTYNHLANVGAQIENWIEKRAIVTDEKDEAYNAELYNLVNHDVYAGYVADFEAEVATLRAAAYEFINAVEDIDNINLDSKAELDAAKILFDKVSKGQKLADLDTILGLYDIYDEDGELVEEVTNFSEAYDAWLTQYVRFNWLVDTKKALEDAAKATLVKCEDATHGKKDANGDIVVCDCENLGTYDYTKFVGDFDNDIVRIIAEYELDETVFDAELLTVYKMARLQTTLAVVMTNLKDAYNNSAQDAKAQALYGIIAEEIKAVAANYTFEAGYTCVDPDNKYHDCDCAEDLNNWVMIIENDPVEALAEKYTPAILADRFN